MTAAPSPIKGIALGFLAYFLFSCSDANVKALGGRLPVFEIGFFSTLFAAAVLLLLKPRGERWRDAIYMHRPRLVALRGIAGASAGILGIYAFTHLPFAEAYALIFLSPSIATILSIFILGEQVGWRRWLAVALGFGGVLAIVRPGFETLEPGHLAAFAVSFCAAGTIIILRTLGQTERRVSLLAAVIVTALALNGVLMLQDFHWPAFADLPHLAVAGVFAGAAQLCLILATRSAPANQVAPAQYSQMVWAIVIGGLFFAEFPDLPAIVGICLIAISGLFTFLREETKGRWWSRIILQRDRV
ncbi:MAG: DMT family transporter [Dongiaceae bacterium]